MKQAKSIKLFGTFAIAAIASVSSFFVCNAYRQTTAINAKTLAAVSDSYFADIENNISSYTRETLYQALHEKINDGWKKISYSELPSHIVNVDFDENGYLNDIYSNEHSIKISSTGNYHKEGDTWNKEHLIPKSWWGGNPSGPSGEGGDMFNMYATDGYVNAMRSNYPFGEVTNIVKKSNDSFSKLGNSNDLSSTYVFEINDKYKALAAHSYFYFCCKNDVMNCSADKYTQGNGSTMFDKDGIFGLTDYASTLFLKWNKDKSNIQFEKDRAMRVYNEQNNLNPFIYHPEWADFIWGGAKLSTNIKLSNLSLNDIKNYEQCSFQYYYVDNNQYAI